MSAKYIGPEVVKRHAWIRVMTNKAMWYAESGPCQLCGLGVLRDEKQSWTSAKFCAMIAIKSRQCQNGRQGPQEETVGQHHSTVEDVGVLLV